MSDEDRPSGPFDGLRLIAGAASLVGKVRAANEDSLLVSSDILVVADGMGGHLAGEVASARAVETLAEAEGHRSLVELVSAVHLANRRISDSAAEDPGLRGMGTTICVVGLVDEDGEHLAILNVGDSRVYLLADGQLNQLTEDHSLVETLVREGRITHAEAEVHPQRNVLTRALGVEALVLVDAWLLLPCDGDRLLLCSDGLFNELSVERITEILQDQDDPEVAARRLAAEAEAAGGRDNITTVVADVSGSGRPPAPYDDRYRRIATPAVDFDDPFRDASSDTATVPLVPIIAVPPRNDDPDGIEEDSDEDDSLEDDADALSVDREASSGTDVQQAGGDASDGPPEGDPGDPRGPKAGSSESGGASKSGIASVTSTLGGSADPTQADPDSGGTVADEQADIDGIGSKGSDESSESHSLPSGEGGAADDDEPGQDSSSTATGKSANGTSESGARGTTPSEVAGSESTSDDPESGGRTWRTTVFIIAVALVIAAAIGVVAVAVRSGWYVGADGNSVVIYKGPVRTLPVLGDSIVERFPDIPVDELPQNKRSKVDAGTRFNSEANARHFVETLEERTPTTTTSTTTTSSTSTTTAGPSTTAPLVTQPTTTAPGTPTPGGNGP